MGPGCDWAGGTGAQVGSHAYGDLPRPIKSTESRGPIESPLGKTGATRQQKAPPDGERGGAKFFLGRLGSRLATLRHDGTTWG
jgi:hypothetical protein